MAKPLVGALPPVLHLGGEHGQAPPWLHIGLQFIANELAEARPAQQALINRIADIMLIECLRNHIENLPAGEGSWLRALRDTQLAATLAAMHAAPERSWSVPELAGIAHLSRSAYAERFRTALGQSPLAYLTDHRMRLAAWQLRNSRLPVCRIAEAVGYGSDTAFSQAFRRSVGQSPTQYRRESAYNPG